MLAPRCIWAALLLLLLLFLAACPAADDPAADLGAPPDLGVTLRPLRNQDVTLVYPLPPPAELDRMVPASAGGAYGPLLPQALFMQLPGPLDPRPGARTSTTGASAWLGLRLVAVRLDPCFGSRGEVPDASCRNQVRLVFQGVQVLGSLTVADDGAVHVLYELPRAELLSLSRSVLALTEREGGYAPAPLGVHPVLARQGLAGAFAQGLRALLVERLGEQRISRMTFFLRTDTLVSGWRFGALDRQGAAFLRATIATTLLQEQTLGAGLPVGGSLGGSTPTPTRSADNLLVLINGALARAVDGATLQAAFGAALRIESPLRHTPETIDCVSCHVAMAARAFGEQGFGLRSAGDPDLFTGPGDLRLQPPPRVSLENVHALSYLGVELGLNQRAVNESAAVAQALSALLLAAAGR